MQMTEPAPYYGLSFGCHQGGQADVHLQASFMNLWLRAYGSVPMAPSQSLPDPQAFIGGQ